MATEARARFFSFKWGSSENTLELQHRFGAAYAELEIQGVPETPETQARVLISYPTERWRSFVDTISMRMPAPTVAEIFAGMKFMEERQNVRDEIEHGEANYVGRAGSGRGAGGVQQYRHQRHQQSDRAAAKAKSLANAIFYCRGRPGHFANKCNLRLSAFCSFCKVEGHVVAECCWRGRVRSWGS